MATDILLEAGTNEMELLVFKINNTPFGINVAKVREIVQRQHNISIPHSPHAVEGSFRLRERVLTLINLGKYFDMEGPQTTQGEGLIIVVEFNEVTCGVLVDEVERIYRLKWNAIESPSQYLIDMSIPVTGIAKVDGLIVQIADFETIVSEILGVQNASLLEEDSGTQAAFKNARIILADDSSILRTNLINVLTQAGYENLTVCNDGQEAWEKIQAANLSPEGPFDLVLTDIEMPRMDGLHLTKRVKEDPQLAHTPVILFSSLITEDNRNKGNAVGANAQVSKPDSKGMIKAIETCLKKARSTVTA